MPSADDTRRTDTKGTRIHWFWRAEEAFQYRHDSVFISRRVGEQYEDRDFSLKFEERSIPPAVVQEAREEFDIEFPGGRESLEAVLAQSEELRSVFDQEEIPEEERRSTAFTDSFLGAFQSNLVSRVLGLIDRAASCADGTVDEFDDEENALRKNNADLASR